MPTDGRCAPARLHAGRADARPKCDGQPGINYAGDATAVTLDDVEDRVARVDVEASRGEEGSADITGPERVTAATVHSAEALDLAERVDGETSRSLEPALVAGARERLEEREPVARGAVADAVALLVTVGAGAPDQLGAGEHELLVEVLPGAGDDTRRAGAPLE